MEHLSCTTSESESSSEETLIDKTPEKRTYRSAILHGITKKKARYHHVTPEKRGWFGNCSITKTGANVDNNQNISVNQNMDHTSTCTSSDSDTDDFTSIPTTTSDSEIDNDSMYPEKDDYGTFDETDSLENQPLYEGCKHTQFSAYSLLMLFVTKRGLCREAFTELLEIVADLLPQEAHFTTSVYKLKDALKTGINYQEHVTHYFCETCQCLLDDCNPCKNNACQRAESKTMEFCDLDFPRQLKEMFKDEKFLQLVTKEKEVHQNQLLKGISSGNRYKEMIADCQRSTDVILTFTLNTDGVALFSSSKKGSLWPVYIAVNELPVKLRFSRKYLIPCYLHCQVEKPNMLTYLTPLMRTLNQIKEKGFEVQTSIGTLNVKGYLLVVSLDLPAKALVANVKQFNGAFSCTLCKVEGKTREGNHMVRTFPFVHQSEIRTHQSWIEDARRASEQGVAVYGIKGVCAPMMLSYVKLPELFVIDWMHAILLGVVKMLMNLWFDNKYKDKEFYIGNKMDLLDKRYLTIQIPDFVSRRQRTITDHKHWKASECREWLVHFSVPVLYGILKPNVYIHYLLLVNCIATLTSDNLHHDQVTEVEEILQEFCQMFPAIYGPEKQTMNLHLVTHLPETVRLYGPLYEYSCFGFESMNSFIKNMVHGTCHINKQISFAVGMSKQLSGIVKRFTGDGVDSRTQQLFQKLGSKLIENENEDDIETKCLGRCTIMKETSPYYQHLMDDMRNQQLRTYGRLRLNRKIFQSKDHQHAKTRCDYVVCYTSDAGREMGIILTFIEVNDQIFALVKKCETAPFTMSQHMVNEVTKHRLKELARKHLCAHILKLVDYGDTILVHSSRLGKKGILMKISPLLTFLSIPPNNLEHN